LRENSTPKFEQPLSPKGKIGSVRPSSVFLSKTEASDDMVLDTRDRFSKSQLNKSKSINSGSRPNLSNRNSVSILRSSFDSVPATNNNKPVTAITVVNTSGVNVRTKANTIDTVTNVKPNVEVVANTKTNTQPTLKKKRCQFNFILFTKLSKGRF